MFTELAVIQYETSIVVIYMHSVSSAKFSMATLYDGIATRLIWQ